MVDIFENETQYEYYGGNIYVSIESIPLEHFSVLQLTRLFSEPDNLSGNAVFHSLFSGDNKHNDCTTAAQSKYIIALERTDFCV